MAKKITRKVFVLDTSVLLHDHNSIFSFDEHDVIIPIPVLEELDQFKKGSEHKNFAAREIIRALDTISEDADINDWLPLPNKEKGRIRIGIMEHPKSGEDALKTFGGHKTDHRIINVALAYKEQDPEREHILVTKDVNLRLKAKALNLKSEDYLTGKIADLDKLYTGISTDDNADGDLIRKLFVDATVEVDEKEGEPWIPNHFYILKNNKSSALAYYNPFTLSLERVEKKFISGIKPKNAEQAFAFHALMNPDVKLVTLQGVAGTGKTLLALASALEQKAKYKQIILARPIVPLANKDIGFLPGEAKDKIGPYMEPLWDNLKFIKNQYGENEKRHKQINELEDSGKIEITALAYIRGRSLSDIFMIIDEAQNLTPHEIKTIITRAGENTKIVFTGDIRQIDTPFLDEKSNGLAYIIERLKKQKLFAHINLIKGERSELANLANDLL
jgi:PhoH-like ATPase